ncbi:MAG: T9SS type A sorting domain-containing protein, partial [Tannerella sp.]|nr:T9SS type A sorting domain-containing protein [Tannerella sp.]
LYYSSIYAYDAGGNLTFFEDHRFTVPTNPSWVWSDEFTAQKYSAAYDSEGRILNSKIDKWYDTGTDWSPEEYTLYYYSESSGTPGVETGAEAWSYGGALHVRTPQPLELTVHTMTGSLVRRQTVGAGETVLPLPQGMYIVHVGGTVKKIAVR